MYASVPDFRVLFSVLALAMVSASFVCAILVRSLTSCLLLKTSYKVNTPRFLLLFATPFLATAVFFATQFLGYTAQILMFFVATYYIFANEDLRKTHPGKSVAISAGMAVTWAAAWIGIAYSIALLLLYLATRS
ncbi:hypothetical protein [Viridibacterium curvum]|uniref:hypothetical protein n=1 Tax=Viridibacterium curvum TaxID=1101404 RepID=UPI0031ECD916